MTPDPRTVPPDDLDRKLSSLFASQVPNPFPAFRHPEPAVPSGLASARNGADAGLRARATLAASVALMVGTCWYLSGGPTGHPTAPPPGAGVSGATADGQNTDILKGIHKAGEKGDSAPLSRP